MRLDPKKLIIQKPGQKFNMTAVIISGGRIVSIGHNDYTRLGYKWKKTNKFKNIQGLHAEIDAILKWKNRKTGATMVVMGYSRAGNPLSSCRPCDSCMNAIVTIGKINKIKYMYGGIWITEKIGG